MLVDASGSGAGASASGAGVVPLSVEAGWGSGLVDAGAEADSLPGLQAVRIVVRTMANAHAVD